MVVKDAKFADVIGLEEMARLLMTPKNTVNGWRQRNERGELLTPMPDPIPGLPIPVYYIDDVVEWAVKGNPPRWPKDRGDPDRFLRTRVVRRSTLPSPRVSEEGPLVGPATLTPETVLFSSTNPDVPGISFAPAL